MGSHTFVGERLEEVKVSLQETVVDQRYTAEGYEDRGDEREIGHGGTVLRTARMFAGLPGSNLIGFLQYLCWWSPAKHLHQTE